MNISTRYRVRTATGVYVFAVANGARRDRSA
jgi:hypothetical protein